MMLFILLVIWIFVRVSTNFRSSFGGGDDSKYIIYKQRKLVCRILSDSIRRGKTNTFARIKHRETGQVATPSTRLPWIRTAIEVEAESHKVGDKQPDTNDPQHPCPNQMRPRGMN